MPKNPHVFDVKAETEHIIEWTKQWFDKNGPEASAVLGISGGKDSTVMAAILAKALGPKRVVGVAMPDGYQEDLSDSVRVIELLGINGMIADIGDVTKAMKSSFANARPLNGFVVPEFSENARINTPPRVRMADLYAVAASLPNGGFVCNTCNLSEDYIGYATKYGDAAGDFAPLADYTVSEIRIIGDYLGLPWSLVHKTPSDGLCGQTDEIKIGFSYAVLDVYIRYGQCPDRDVRAKIDRMHAASAHKRELMQFCPRLAA